MHLVQQITPFTCGLACIESFTTDQRKTISQSALLTRYKGKLLQTIPKPEVFGATNLLDIAYILQDLGFKVVLGKDHRKDAVREQLKQWKDALICANHKLQAWHCWRFDKVVDDDSISAMNPGFFLPAATIETVTIDDLINWDYSFILVSQ